MGKNTVLPYLLDRRITKLDYIFISHFDQDHIEGLLYVMKEIKVKNVIVGKQFENSDNLQKFLEIINQNNIKTTIVEAESKIEIEKDVAFEILWPDSNKPISEKTLNNNAMVCKLVNNKFSMLFTGDIEKIAEKEIVNKYINTKKLESNILKVAHHGAKSSSSNEFLEKVNPSVAVIGVGKNNLYGHPSDETITNLQKKNVKIYRTDKYGEISIKVDKKGGYKVNKFIKNGD